MKGIIDTSSLVAITRYYLPFDVNGKLANELKVLFDKGEFVIIDKVFGEAKYVSKGIALKGLTFIDSKPNRIVNTTAVLPSANFFRELETNYCNQNVRKGKKLTPAEFENEKRIYLGGADAKQILYALNMSKSNLIIVTEETIAENDNKIFKKIPNICSLAGVACCTVPDFLKNYCKFDLSTLLR